MTDSSQLRLGDQPQPSADRPAFFTDEECLRMHRALCYLADPGSWLGDPTKHSAILLGHDTPYELARDTLARAA